MITATFIFILLGALISIFLTAIALIIFIHEILYVMGFDSRYITKLTEKILGDDNTEDKE